MSRPNAGLVAIVKHVLLIKVLPVAFGVSEEPMGAYPQPSTLALANAPFDARLRTVSRCRAAHQHCIICAEHLLDCVSCLFPGLFLGGRSRPYLPFRDFALGLRGFAFGLRWRSKVNLMALPMVMMTRAIRYWMNWTTQTTGFDILEDPRTLPADPMICSESGFRGGLDGMFAVGYQIS